MKIAFVAAFAAIAGYGVYANQKVDTMSDLMLANVEALARYEVNPDCLNGCTKREYGMLLLQNISRSKRSEMELIFTATKICLECSN